MEWRFNGLPVFRLRIPGRVWDAYGNDDPTYEPDDKRMRRIYSSAESRKCGSGRSVWVIIDRAEAEYLCGQYEDLSGMVGGSQGMDRRDHPGLVAMRRYARKLRRFFD